MNPARFALAALLLAISAACVQTRVPAPPPQPPLEAKSLTGVWRMTVESPMGADDLNAELVQQGDRLSGVMHTRSGEVPVTGRVQGEAVSFSMELDVNGSALQIGYEGRVAEDAMSGTVAFGDMGTGTFKATRQ